MWQAALAARQPGAQEPIAWKYRAPGNSFWRVSLHKPVSRPEWECEPLYAAPPAQGIDLGQIVEQIAQQWDDCTYDAVGETIDISEAIRAAGKRLTGQRDAAPGVGNG